MVEVAGVEVAGFQVRSNYKTHWSPKPGLPTFGKNVNIAKGCVFIGTAFVSEGVSFNVGTVVRCDEGVDVFFGKDCTIGKRVVFHGLEQPEEGNTRQGPDNKSYSIYLGERVVVGDDSIIHGPVLIGNDVEIGENCFIISATIKNDVLILPGKSVIGNIIIPEGRIVDRDVTTQEEANNLPLNTEENRAILKKGIPVVSPLIPVEEPKIQEYIIIGKYSSFDNTAKFIGGTVKIGDFTYLAPYAEVGCDGPTTIGNGVNLQDYVKIKGKGNVTIGDNTSLAHGALISASEGKTINIGANCFVGMHSQVYASVGDGSYIGHRAKVYIDIPAGVIVPPNAVITSVEQLKDLQPVDPEPNKVSATRKFMNGVLTVNHKLAYENSRRDESNRLNEQGLVKPTIGHIR
jgi:carbon dioxide concentrating mechanism protein CcmM